MARENKIGLLVGLAFIIAVGILCSDYLSVTNEPPRASLQLAGSTVRSSLGDPAPASDPLSPPAVVRVPNAIVPGGQVTTAGELAARARRPAVAPPPIAPIVTGPESTPPTAFAAVPMRLAPVPPASNQALIDAAGRAGEALVAPTARSATVGVPHPAAPTVEAEAGDSLGDLAQKAYGSSTRATRAALVAANPSLRANPDLIVAGRSYLAPSADTAPAGPTSPARPPATVALYTVQPGDTLWSIASRQVGTGKAVPAILDLNPGVQRGTPLRLNMRLRLPKRKAIQD